MIFEKIKWSLNFLDQSGPTIIYVSSKKVCLELANMIYHHGYLTGIYHGDLSYQERHTVQNQFMENFIPSSWLLVLLAWALIKRH